MKFLWFIAIFTAITVHGQLARNPGFYKPNAVASSGGGGITVPHVWKATNASGATVVVTVAPTAGNVLVASMGEFGGTGAYPPPGDNINGTNRWKQIIVSDIQNQLNCGFWIQTNCPAGITSVTNTATSAAAIMGFVHEVSGLNVSAPFTTGESAKSSSGIATTLPTSGVVTTATANSIIFAIIVPNTGANPATMTLNATGTVGTWSLADANNSQELDGSANIAVSGPSIVVSSALAYHHVWTTANVEYSACIFALHQ